MAKGLIEIALQLGSKLGANTSKFLGTRSNVSFLGTGPKDGMLFQKEINPESFATLGIEKVLPDIESSLAYAAGGKLDDFQLSRLIKNLKTMDETINPTNVVEMGTGGIDSLRAKSGIGERQVTEAVGDTSDTSPLMSKLENRVSDLKDEEGLAALRDRTGDNNVPLRSMSEILANPRKMADEAAFPGETFNAATESASGRQLLDKFSEIKNRAPAPLETGSATAIMETVPKAELPGKTAAAREFLVNSLKVGDEASSTTLSDVMSAQDMKYIMEGGGGVMGDPIVLVQKYFGPRIAEMIPSNATTEEMTIFTRRVMNNVEDAKGFRPDEPEFDPLTAMFVDNLADGGRAGYAKGGLAKILEL